MTALDHIRFRFAFSRAQREAVKTAALLAGLLAAYGIAGAMDYAEEQRREAEAMAQSNRALTATLADCLNGNARFLHDGPHTDGYAKTAVVCRKAEEYKL